MTDYSAIIDSPIGKLGIQCDANALQRISFLPSTAALQSANDKFSASVISQLEAYFADAGYNFTLALAHAGTPFQQRVWQHMQAISLGTTLSYGQLAHQLNTSPRAIGNACRSNALPIIIPCHRIVGATTLGGYSGHTSGATWSIKGWLLSHEAKAHKSIAS